MAEVVVDDAEFNKAFNEYMKDTSRTMATACNATLQHICAGAGQSCKVATAEKIASDLRTNVTFTDYTTRRGTIKKKKSFSFIEAKQNKATKVAYLIVNARNKAEGKPAVTGEEMDLAAQKLYNSRVSHTKSAASSFNPPASKLSSAMPGEFKMATVQRRLTGEPMGDALPAQPKLVSWDAESKMWVDYRGSKNGQVSQRLKDVLHQALNMGIQKETEEKVNHMLEKMAQKDVDKFNKS